MKRAYFVTGTGTSVGKTYVTRALARRARTLGQSVFAFKPIETGCTWNDSRLVGSDQELLVEAAGDWQRDELRGLYRFEKPVAPRAAALLERVPIELERIRRTVEAVAASVDLVLVEGAGGWRVPVTDDADMSTLARLLACPIVIVAAATLGTINHSVLTIEAVRRDGCEVAALVVSRQPTDDRTLAFENASEIQRLTSCTSVVLEEEPSVLDDLLRTA